MFIFFTVFAFVSLSAHVSAQQTKSLWLLGHYEGSIEGSIINSVWTINCATKGPVCSLPPSLTVTEGSSTLAYTYTLENNYSFKVACQLMPRISSGDCSLTLQSESEVNVKTTIVGPDVLSQVPVTITAGPGSSPATPTPAKTTETPQTTPPPYPIPSASKSFSQISATLFIPSTDFLPGYGNKTISPTSDFANFPIPTQSSSSIVAKPTISQATSQRISWNLVSLIISGVLFYHSSLYGL
ncbi:hypothetical protein K3495_g13310 [Podosphaera aphanis]|nr:hypothetical protein K3495_g13310 [Podosphaera aphanis]